MAATCICHLVAITNGTLQLGIRNLVWR